MILQIKRGTTVIAETSDFTYSPALQEVRKITCEVVSVDKIEFKAYNSKAQSTYDTVSYNGNTFILYIAPSGEHRNESGKYKYSLVFYGREILLQNVAFLDVVTSGSSSINQTRYTHGGIFSFFGDHNQLAQRIIANVDTYNSTIESSFTGIGTWTITFDIAGDVLESMIDISDGTNTLEVLKYFYDNFNLNYYFSTTDTSGNIFITDKKKKAITHTFKQGDGNGAVELTSSVDTNTPIITRIIPQGGSRNVPPNYKKSSNPVDDSRYCPFILLPDVNGNIRYHIDSVYGLEHYGIRGKTIASDFSGIYPSIRGKVLGDLYPSGLPAWDTYNGSDPDSQSGKVAGSGVSSSTRIDRIIGSSAINSEDDQTFNIYVTSPGFNLGYKVYTEGQSGGTINDTFITNDFKRMSFSYVPYTTKESRMGSVYTYYANALNIVGKMTGQIEVTISSINENLVGQEISFLLRMNVNDASGTVTSTKSIKIANTLDISTYLSFDEEVTGQFLGNNKVMAEIRLEATTSGGNAGDCYVRVNKNTAQFTINFNNVAAPESSKYYFKYGTNTDAVISMRTGLYTGTEFAIDKNGVIPLYGEVDSSRGETAADVAMFAKGARYKYICKRTESDNSKYPLYTGDGSPALAANSEFVMLGLVMPDTYVIMAENTLLRASQDFLSKYDHENKTVTVKISSGFVAENPIVFNLFDIGNIMKVRDDAIGIYDIGDNGALSDMELQIQGIEIKYSSSDLFPSYSCTLARMKQMSFYERLAKESQTYNTTQTTNITTGSGTGSGNNLFSEKLLNELINSWQLFNGWFEWDKARVALKCKSAMYTDQWISALGAEIGTGGGGSGGGLINSLWRYADLGKTFNNDDNDTFNAYTINEIWKLAKDGGGIKTISITGSGNALTDVEKSSDGKTITFIKGQTFTLKTDFDVLNTKVTTFLEGTDTDDIINKWKELEAFLSGMKESDNLAEILKNKADKTYVDQNFVTLATTQTITGQKTFSSVLKTSDIYPSVSGGKNLGSTDLRWLLVNAVGGDFTGSVNAKSVVSTDFVQIGDARIQWDATNKAIYVINKDGVTEIGFYTKGWISALGAEIGTGGGGSSTLAGLLDVTISSPQDGQSLKYDASSQKWVNGTIDSFNTSQMWTELARVDSSKVIDISHLPTTALDGRWVKKSGDTMTGNLNISGDIISTSANAFRMAHGGNYGIILRNDATNFYMLVTNTGDAMGNWNNLRPFYINMSNGAVHMDNGVSALGFHHNSANDNNYILLAGGGYKSISSLQDTYDGRYVKKSGDTMTGDLVISNGKSIYLNQSSATSTQQIRLQGGDNDYGRIAVGATATNAAWMEIATADDGNEPIVARQYTGVYSTKKNEMILLDINGDTSIAYGRALYLNRNGSKQTKTNGEWIHGGADVCSSSDANLRFGSWYGIGWYPTYSGGSVGQGNNAMWLDVRYGNLNVIGRYYSNIATGTAPYQCASTTLNTNLNADLLDGYHQSSFIRTNGINQYVTLTGGNGNIEGYRLVLDATVSGGWSINDMTLLVNSRHSGTGIISIVFHTTNQESTTFAGSLNYYGSLISFGNTMWRLFYNPSTKKLRLFWHYFDYNDCQVSILNRRGIMLDIANASWYTTIPSDMGTEIPSYYNATDKLITPRSINGTSFDGSADIVTSYWGTARSFYIQDYNAGHTGSAVSVNGSRNPYLKLPSTINASLSGNASTATTLQTARTINGTSFNGSANITTSYWGTARTINGTSINGSTNYTTAYWGTTRTFYIQDNPASYTGAGISVNGSGNVYLRLPNSIVCGDWFRSTGNTGWYSNTYGGGIYMSDSTWVRIWNSKRFYVGNVDNTDFSTNTAISTEGGIYAKKNITSSANIYANGAMSAKTSSSDIRLKKDIMDFRAIGIVRRLRPVTFHWNDVAKSYSPALNHDNLNYGMIAQDVKSIAELPNFTNNVFGEYLILHYEKFIPIILQGMKEIDSQQTKHEREIEELKREVRILKQKLYGTL